VTKLESWALAAGAALQLAAVWSACAATTERDEPIYLEADRVEIDDVRGVSTYTGTVSVSQGDMRLRGDRVVVYSENRDPARYVATGRPAEFRQRAAADQPEVVATAREIEYGVRSDALELRGNAVIVQCGDRFEGERLSYDAARSRVTAGGGTSGRVRMVIQPQRERGADCAPLAQEDATRAVPAQGAPARTAP
jgi:lipopolysaccharide export system protein LptA